MPSSWGRPAPLKRCCSSRAISGSVAKAAMRGAQIARRRDTANRARQPSRAAGVGDGDNRGQMIGEGLRGLEHLRGTAAAADSDNMET